MWLPEAMGNSWANKKLAKKIIIIERNLGTLKNFSISKNLEVYVHVYLKLPV